MRVDFEICLGNVSPDFRTGGIRRKNVHHQATMAVEGNFEEVEGVELILIVVLDWAGPSADQLVLFCHNGRKAN